jgi:hypothetical protein
MEEDGAILLVKNIAINFRCISVAVHKMDWHA